MRTTALPLAGILALSSVLALSGCASALDALSDRREARYPDAGQFADSGAVPEADALVPDDATSIAVALYTDKSERILTFVSATGPAECVPGPLTGDPTLESSWWPADEPVDGTVCGDWQVFAAATTWYAWIN